MNMSDNTQEIVNISKELSDENKQFLLLLMKVAMVAEASAKASFTKQPA